MALASALTIGTRIRERRMDLGLRQADLAKSLEISPSYLNLIEHNRRRIAGPLLEATAKVLDLDPVLLTQGAERGILEQLQAAAADADSQPEIDRAEEFAVRYPGWAGVVAGQQSRVVALETRIQELTDRLTHDPELATSLHGVISAVTSIRSASSILTSDEQLDADWLSRFHKNIHEDAIRLAGSSDALVRYLDAPADQEVPLSPFDEVTHFLGKTEFYLEELEGKAVSIEHVAEAAKLSSFATQILQDHLENYQRVAQSMPGDTMRQAISNGNTNPDVLSKEFQVPLSDVMLRLATLPSEDGLPQIGFAQCDGAGAVTLQKAIPGFALSGNGLACPLWPLFTAIGQVDRPIQQVVTLSGQRQDRFQCYAIATQSVGSFSMPPIVRSTMLVIADPDLADVPALPLGPSCRICPRRACPARREPSALGATL